MGKKRTIVEINGRKYDATTGQIITEGPQPPQVIDGFRVPISPIQPKQINRQRAVTEASTMHANQQRTQKLHPAAAKKLQTPPNRIAAVRPAQSQRQIQVQPHSDSTIQVGQTATTKRADRAKKYQQSQQVQKFSQPDTTPQPQPEAETPMAPPVSVLPKVPQAQPETQPAAQQTPSNNTVDPAIEPNNAPKQSFFKRRPKLVTTTATALLVIAMGGYYVYSNIPTLALRIASSRAGIEASLPRYRPTGYNFSGPIAYSEGTIELEFASNSDDRTYKITQQESTWDSQSLLSNFIEPITNDYVTFQERGLTIYVYDDHFATWVDSGVWYTIEGNSLMSSEQLLKIADSL